VKTVKGRVKALPTLFKYYLDDMIFISLTNEKISVFHDGSIKRTISSKTKGARK